MKIIRMRIDNIKGMAAFECEPQGGHVVLKGKNGAGKSSVLDSILLGLTGKGSAQPLRNGAKKGGVLMEVGDYTIERKYSKSGGKLRVLNKDENEISSPQAFLNSLVGTGLAFDPQRFADMDPKPQKEMLLKAAGLDVELGEIDKLHGEIFATRTAENRFAKQFRAEIAGIEVPADTPESPVNVEAMEGEIAQIHDQEGQYRTWKAEKVRIEERILAIQEDLKTYQEALQGHVIETPDRPDPGKADELREAIASAHDTNQAVAARVKRDELEQRAKDVETRSKKMTEKLASMETRKTELLSKAIPDVPGLEVTDDGIAINGVALSEINHAESIKVGVKIALAQDPKFRIILIDEASSLDSDSLAVLCDVAKEQDAQLWLAQVGDSPSVGFEIMEGNGEEE